MSWPGELEQNAQTPPASHTASPAAAAYRVPANLDQAIASLPLERRMASAPRRIGYLVNYKFHIWYQILMEVMRRRSGMYDAVLKVVDFQKNVATQIEAARKLLPDVDALILTPVASTGPEVITEMAAERGIPVSKPIQSPECKRCDYDAGMKVGR